MDSSINVFKTLKKRKHPSGNSFNNTPKKKKFSRNSDASKELVKKKKFSANKLTKSQASSAEGIQISNKSGKSNESINVNKGKKSKKNILKTRNITDAKSPSLVQLKRILKSKKNKKIKKVPSSVIQASPSVSKDASTSPAIKKLKRGKKLNKGKKLTSNLEENINSESSDELSDICISDDSESDEEVLRDEIQNSSVFKQIEKLMKKVPHLNPANAGLESPEDSEDEDAGNSSDMSLSEESDNEDSTMETDDQDASSSESELKDSDLKNEASSKKVNTFVKREDKNTLLEIKKTESFSFNRTSKDSTQRNISDKEKKGVVSSNLKSKVQEKLAGAKFRFLNEKLYTGTGKEAFKYFQENTDEFEDYHSGYRLQVSKWPMNPVNQIIADIQQLKKSSVVADLGCGEAKIAQTFPDRTIHSFDLVPLNEFVKACDISKLPLQRESVDVVVFCLSLMGTNLKEYLFEAFRILKVGGILKIAEVESRIENLRLFIKYLKAVGFNLVKQNTKHKMFVFLDLRKERQKRKMRKIPSLSLRPCLYKKR